VLIGAVVVVLVMLPLRVRRLLLPVDPPFTRSVTFDGFVVVLGVVVPVPVFIEFVPVEYVFVGVWVVPVCGTF
jgi:hypothetical protein